MEDPVAITFQSFDRAAAAELVNPQPQEEDPAWRRRVEYFLLRTGRPLPRVVVLGRDLALVCRQMDLLGGAAVGVDGGANVIALARHRYPAGEFLQGDLRRLPVESNSFDGAWTSTVPAHIPRASVVEAMASVHAALRPGGLLHVRLPLGEGEGFEATPHGMVYRARWNAEQFSQAVSALDFELLESEPLPGAELGMILRREY
jgi:SAM-dependent methyltransferase